MTGATVLMSDVGLGESPRWHADRLWFSDWRDQVVVAVDTAGRSERIVSVPSPVCCIDFLPDGRLLVVSGAEGRLLVRQADGSMTVHADLAGLEDTRWNDIVVDGRGNIYVNNIGFDLMAGGAVQTGSIALVRADGSTASVADGVAFPNGMAVTPDNATLILAESYGRCLTGYDIEPDGTLTNRRVWADLGDGVPDGICIDADGAVWYADVPNRRCVRVAEGGEVLATVEVDRGCFACMLGGEEGTTLYIVAATWLGPDAMFSGPRTGQVLTAPAPARGAGWP